MLSRLVIAPLFLILVAAPRLFAAERDYLQRGERELQGREDVAYDAAVRDVLSRGWRSDVVLRMLDLPPFQPEWVAGIARARDGYRAFSVEASKQVWGALGFGSSDPKQKKGDYHSVHPVLHERPISPSVAARIAALWRRVLADQRNYGKDPNLYLDTDQLSFYLSFQPTERLTAHTVGLGPKLTHLWHVSALLANYAEGMSERELIKEVAKRERTLGI